VGVAVLSKQRAVFFPFRPHLLAPNCAHLHGELCARGGKALKGGRDLCFPPAPACERRACVRTLPKRTCATHKLQCASPPINPSEL